jgi:alkylhydroperoxidase family enzyme
MPNAMKPGQGSGFEDSDLELAQMLRVGDGLAPRPPRAQHVEAHAREDRRQPTREIVNIARIGAAEPQPSEVWQEVARHYDEPALAALIIQIGLINVWNRLNATVRQVAGE